MGTGLNYFACPTLIPKILRGVGFIGVGSGCSPRAIDAVIDLNISFFGGHSLTSVTHSSFSATIRVNGNSVSSPVKSGRGEMAIDLSNSATIFAVSAASFAASSAAFSVALLATSAALAAVFFASKGLDFLVAFQVAENQRPVCSLVSGRLGESLPKIFASGSKGFGNSNGLVVSSLAAL